MRLRNIALRTLLIAGLLSASVGFHIPTHLASAVARISQHPAWIDRLQFPVPGFQMRFWIPPVLVIVALVLRNGGHALPARRPALHRRDIVIAATFMLVASAIRLWPLLHNPWLKPDNDEGIYLGGAWLLRSGVLPYRDFVFPHLPGSLLLLQPAAAFVQLWHDNTRALLAARGLVAVSDGVAAGLIYLAARQAVTAPGALLAAAVYCCDTLAVDYSRGVRLEPLQAPWLVIGAVLVLALFNGRRVGVWAGFFLAVGVSIKIAGAVVPLAALGVCLIERRWQALRDLVVGLALGAVAVCGWFLLVTPVDLLQQTIVLQLMRPSAPYRDRWGFLFGEQESALTALLAFCGICALTMWLWHRRVASAWLFVCLWLALNLLLFALAASFFPHYYTSLVAPAALLAAAVPEGLRRIRWSGWRLIVSMFLVAAAWGEISLWPATDRSPVEQAPIAALQALPPGKSVLTFVPLFNVLAGRPLLKAPPAGPYLLDTSLGNPYLDSRLNRRWQPSDATRRAAAGSADYILGSRVDTGRIPELLRSFTWQEITPGNSTLLFTRRDAPEDIVNVGQGLQLLQRPPARVEVVAGQRAIIQPLYWRSAGPPPADLALSLRLVTATGGRLAQVDVPLGSGTSWKPDEINTIEYRIPLSSDRPAATDHVEVVVYSSQNQQPVLLQPARGASSVAQLELPIPVGQQ